MRLTTLRTNASLAPALAIACAANPATAHGACRLNETRLLMGTVVNMSCIVEKEELAREAMGVPEALRLRP